jgi:tetratricopeptide (TPR) repeat protein
VAGQGARKEVVVTLWSAFVPGGLLAWQERRRALRQLDNLERLDASVLTLDESNLVNRAKVALEIGDTAGALRFWQDALMRYPRYAKQSHDALGILTGLRRFDEAEVLMLEGQQRDSRDAYYAEGYALVAERRGDNEEALQRWGRVRKKFPAYPMAYAHSVMCLKQAGRLDAAEALNEKAIRLFPKDVRSWEELARIAEQRQDWPEAIRRWELVCEKFRHIPGEIGVAHALAELGRFEEAEQRLKAAQPRAPLVPEINIALARLANQRGDKEEAVLRWADVRRRFPRLLAGYQGSVRHLLEMGRPADAETILLEAIDRFPAEAWPTVEYAFLARKQQDRAGEAERWTAVRAGWPDRPDGYAGGAEALTALGRHDEAAEIRAEHQRRFVR